MSELTRRDDTPASLLFMRQTLAVKRYGRRLARKRGVRERGGGEELEQIQEIRCASEHRDAIDPHQKSLLQKLFANDKEHKDFCDISRLAAYSLGCIWICTFDYLRVSTAYFFPSVCSHGITRAATLDPKKAGCSFELVSDLRIVSFTKASSSPFVLFHNSLPLASIDEYRKKLAV